MPSHLHTQLPLATRTRRDDVASMLAIENDLAETIIVTLEHAERTLGRDHNSQVSQALRHANKLLEAHGIEPIIDRDYWVNPYFGDAIALYINLGDNTLPTILFDTTDILPSGARCLAPTQHALGARRELRALLPISNRRVHNHWPAGWRATTLCVGGLREDEAPVNIPKNLSCGLSRVRIFRKKRWSLQEQFGAN